MAYPKTKNKQLRSEEFCKKILHEADFLRKESILTDVTLKSREGNFFAHKIILSSVSKFFKDIFTSKDSCNEIPLDISADTMESILTFCYTGEIIVDKNSKILLVNIIEAANVLQIPALSNCCFNLILEYPRVNELLFLWETVDEFCSKILTKLYFERILNNLGILVKTEKFLNLTPEQLNLLYHNTSCTSYQDKVLEGILVWVKYNVKGRVRYLTGLLKTVQWHNINAGCLQKFRDEQILLRNAYFQKIFERALLLPGMPQDNAETVFKPMPPTNLREITANFQIPFQIKEKAVKLTEPQQHFPPRENVTGNTELCSSGIETVFKPLTIKAHIPRRLFINGFHGQSRRILVYNCENGIWGEVENHPLSKRHEFAVCSYKDSVYHFGGRDDFHYPVKYSYVFHTICNQWVECKVMRTPRWAASAVVLGSHIYILGGITNGNNGYICLKSMERFDPNINKWDKAADLPGVYECPPVAAIDEKLCMITESSLVWYVPNNDEWKVDPVPLPAEIKDVNTRISSGNCLVLVLRKFSPKNVYLFNTTTYCWSQERIPVNLEDCEIITNLHNPECLEFLIVCSDCCYIYRPPCSWKYFKPMNIVLPAITVVKAND